MRGSKSPQTELIYQFSLESKIPKKHPIRKLRRVVDLALSNMDDAFDALYSQTGRPSIPPEQLIRALFLQIFYSIRSERQLMERLNFDLCFRWFVGLDIDDEVWHPTTFSKNRDRLLTAAVAKRVFAEVKAQAQSKKLLSKKHFSADGTLLDASASLKSFVRKDRPKDDEDDGSGPGSRNEEVNFHGQKRGNDTHESQTDPDARLYRKGMGKEAKLSYMGHLLTENRNGLIVEADVSQATGTAEREVAAEMLAAQGRQRKTLGADRGYDVRHFHEQCRSTNTTPHVATRKDSKLDRRTTRHASYAVSQRKRKQVEEPNGWLKDIGGLRKLRHRGLGKVRTVFVMAAAAYNIVRLLGLEPDDHGVGAPG